MQYVQPMVISTNQRLAMDASKLNSASSRNEFGDSERMTKRMNDGEHQCRLIHGGLCISAVVSTLSAIVPAVSTHDLHPIPVVR